MVLRVEEGTSDESEGFADESVAAETEDQNSYQAREDSSEAGKPNGHSLRWENGTTQYYFQEISGIPVMPHEETVAHSLRIRPVAKRYIKIEKELENLRTDLRIKDWTEKDRAGAEKREKELVKEVGRLQTPRFIDAVNAMVEGYIWQNVLYASCLWQKLYNTEISA